MKECSQCLETKSLSEFTNKKMRDKQGKDNLCKVCRAEVKLNAYRTKDGVAYQIFASQLSSSKTRGDILPTHNKEELKAWLFSQDVFNDLFSVWAASDYDKLLKPSCDRLDDYKPYTLDNIKLTTWGDNKKKGEQDRKNGINNKVNKAVIQLSLDGNVVAEFHSASEANRVTKVSRKAISDCCNNKPSYHTAGGFKWKFKD